MSVMSERSSCRRADERQFRIHPVEAAVERRGRPIDYERPGKPHSFAARKSGCDGLVRILNLSDYGCAELCGLYEVIAPYEGTPPD